MPADEGNDIVIRIGALSERYADPVLRFMLSAGGEVKYSDMKPIVNNFPTLIKLMGRLDDEGLVEVWKTNQPYKTNYAKLTPLGEIVAGKLREIEEIVRAEIEDTSD